MSDKVDSVVGKRTPLSKQAQIVKALSGRPIAFHVVFARLAGSVTAGLLLSQGVYWQSVCDGMPGKDGWFFESMRSWKEQTALTKREQESARKQLRKLVATVDGEEQHVWSEKLAGVPATVHYHVDLEALAACVLAYDAQADSDEPDDEPDDSRSTSWRETRQLDGAKRADYTSETSPQTSSLCSDPPTATQETATAHTKTARGATAKTATPANGVAVHEYWQPLATSGLGADPLDAAYARVVRRIDEKFGVALGAMDYAWIADELAEHGETAVTSGLMLMYEHADNHKWAGRGYWHKCIVSAQSEAKATAPPPTKKVWLDFVWPDGKHVDADSPTGFAGKWSKASAT